jgi:hypothetical protein
MGTGVVTRGVKCLGTVVGNWSSVVEGKKARCYNSTPLCAFMGVAGCLCQLVWLDMARRLTLEVHDIWRLRLQEIIFTPSALHSSKFLWNFDVDLPECTVSLSRRLQSEKSNVENAGMSPK